MKECPYCKSDFGYYTKNIQRYAQFYTFNGEPDGTGEMHQSRGGSVKYCIDCGRKLPKEKTVYEKIKERLKHEIP
jgi:Zn-finger protein